MRVGIIAASILGAMGFERRKSGALRWEEERQLAGGGHVTHRKIIDVATTYYSLPSWDRPRPGYVVEVRVDHVQELNRYFPRTLSGLVATVIYASVVQDRLRQVKLPESRRKVA